MAVVGCTSSTSGRRASVWQPSKLITNKVLTNKVHTLVHRIERGPDSGVMSVQPRLGVAFGQPTNHICDKRCSIWSAVWMALELIS